MEVYGWLTIRGEEYSMMMWRVEGLQLILEYLIVVDLCEITLIAWSGVEGSLGFSLCILIMFLSNLGIL